MRTPIIYIAFAGVFIFLYLAAPLHSQEATEWPVDVYAQLQEGISPKVTIALGDERRGRIRISEDSWWMFLLHLRPLDEGAPLSLRTTKDLLINFWNTGSKNVQLTDEAGSYDTMGKKVYYAEALFTQGTIRTRFLVWDDPERNRRYIADMNINIGKDTPDSLLLVTQQLIALSARAYNTPPPGNLPEWLSKEESFEDINLSINIPEDCSASTFPGFNSLRGERPASEWASMWVLPKGSNWRMDLTWGPQAAESPEEWIKEQLPDSLGSEAIVEVKQVKLEEIAPGQWIGNAVTTTTFNRRETVESWRLVAAEWKSQGNTYRSLVACNVFNDKWGIKIDGMIDDSLLHSRAARWFARIQSAPAWQAR